MLVLHLKCHRAYQWFVFGRIFVIWLSLTISSSWKRREKAASTTQTSWRSARLLEETRRRRGGALPYLALLTEQSRVFHQPRGALVFQHTHTRPRILASVSVSLLSRKREGFIFSSISVFYRIQE